MPTNIKWDVGGRTIDPQSMQEEALRNLFNQQLDQGGSVYGHFTDPSQLKTGEWQGEGYYNPFTGQMRDQPIDDGGKGIPVDPPPPQGGLTGDPKLDPQLKALQNKIHGMGQTGDKPQFEPQTLESLIASVRSAQEPALQYDIGEMLSRMASAGEGRGIWHSGIQQGLEMKGEGLLRAEAARRAVEQAQRAQELDLSTHALLSDIWQSDRDFGWNVIRNQRDFDQAVHQWEQEFGLRREEALHNMSLGNQEFAHRVQQDGLDNALRWFIATIPYNQLTAQERALLELEYQRLFGQSPPSGWLE